MGTTRLYFWEINTYNIKIRIIPNTRPSWLYYATLRQTVYGNRKKQLNGWDHPWREGRSAYLAGFLSYLLTYVVFP